MKKKLKLKVGSRVLVSEWRGKAIRGTVLEIEKTGWCLVGHGPTFAGHSGEFGQSKVPTRYKGHCWYYQPQDFRVIGG